LLKDAGEGRKRSEEVMEGVDDREGKEGRKRGASAEREGVVSIVDVEGGGLDEAE